MRRRALLAVAAIAAVTLAVVAVRSLRHAPSLARLRNEGLALFEERDSRGAEERFRAALAAAPSSAVEHYNLALVARKLGRLDAARALLDRAVALDPSLPHARYALGLLDKDVDIVVKDNPSNQSRGRTHIVLRSRSIRRISASGTASKRR